MRTAEETPTEPGVPLPSAGVAGRAVGSLRTPVLARLIAGDDLSAAEAGAAMSEVLSGAATPVWIAAFAVALRAKGETAVEMAAMVRAMLAVAERIEIPGTAPLVDTCGTGGDGSGTINVSTLAALVAAAAGARVAKHGNRSASSRCGSADVLERLGVVIDLGAAGVARCVTEAGIGFCFAPRFHPALRHAAAVRRELAVPTTFNLLGPLANPAGVTRQVLGVGKPDVAERMVATLIELGRERAFVFFGDDGLDELTTTTTSTVWEIADGGARRFVLEPAELGLPRARRADLVVDGGPEASAAAARAILDGGDRGPKRDLVVLNAAAALVVASRAASLAEGVGMAAQALDDGRAEATLGCLVATSRAAADEEAGGG